MFTPEEENLLKQLESPSSSGRPNFLKQVETLIESQRGCLVGYTLNQKCKLLNKEDIDDIVTDAMVIAYQRLRDQYLGKSVALEYSRKYEISFLGWICRIIGKPYAGKASGLITEKLKAKKKQQLENTSLDDYDLERNDPVGTNQAFHTIEEIEATEDILLVLNMALASISPQKEFVFRVITGIHDYDELTHNTLQKLAKTAGYNHAEQSRIKTVSTELLSNSEEPSGTLDKKITGLLMGIKPRQTSNILSSARKEIRKQFRIHQVSHCEI